MTTPVAHRQAATGDPPPGWLLTALVDDLADDVVDDACAVLSKLAELDTHDPESAGSARDFARATLADWGADEIVFDAQLVISELVTNAMRHAGGVVELRLFRSETHLACAITDGSAAIPVVAEEDCFSESGRGLHLVKALTSAWGWIVMQNKGKLVWAVLTP